MNMKRVLMIFLIAVAIISSVSAVSAGLFDDLLGQNQDNVVEIENITFQTINETKLEFGEMYGGWNCYYGENDTGYAVYIANFSLGNDSQWDGELKEFEESIANLTMENISGVKICNESVIDDNGTEKIWYETYVIDEDHRTVVELLSTDLNETIKMASTLEFK